MFIRSIMGYSELAVFEGKMDLIDRLNVEHVFFFRTIIFLKKIIYLFLGRGEGKEKDRERNIDGLPLTCPPTGNLACNPGMCPDWESNHDLSVCGTTPNPLSHTSQGGTKYFSL